MGYKDHVISIYRSKRCQTVTHDGEKGNEDVVDNIDDIELPSTNIDPTCTEGSH